jgi:glycine hydroxymethyltransferase
MTAALEDRAWLPGPVADRIDSIRQGFGARTAVEVARWLDELIVSNRVIHDQTCLNLNPASNVMNPRAEAMLSAGLGSRPSLASCGRS